MTTEITKVNEISPSTMDMADIKAAAIAVLAGEYEDPDGVSEIVLKALIDEYNDQSLRQQYRVAKISGNPMRYLCEKFFYPTIRVKGKDAEREIEDSQKRFDLVSANKAINPASGGIGADREWVNKSADLCKVMSAQAAIALGDEAAAKFFAANANSETIREIQREIEEGKNPFSNRKLLPQLEGVIQSMLGEDTHISKYDLNFLILTYVNDKNNSPTAVTDRKHSGFVKLLMKVCNRIITNRKGYVLDSKLVAKAK